MGRAPDVIGFVAPSGTGKTTLLCRLVPLLREAGLRVGAVKHTHHGFDLDRPGKDSFRLREAGVSQVLLVSPRRWALLVERGSAEADLSLEQALEHLERERLDVVLIEGYRGTRYPKIELWRPDSGEEPLYPRDDSVIAVAASGALPVPTGLPVLPLDEPARVADFVLARVGRDRQGRPPTGRVVGS